ncbi:VOC family protein [Pelagibaculum spongiae]|uniref:Glyoxalase/bleomycin resistance/dioxygenase family protein n=1 Tax=Pelagibaculum spongiae TaxID=2080658 RepID=A0A2V1GXX3_9GAMM|nr:VOC family protein [Pelagibaculum spongiae]PVZ66725.1 glyoxalase/bleomycin resistance/dioxygenase family protein [Pelagibaculum spongiae]
MSSEVKPAALFLYVDNIPAALDWYQKAFPRAQRNYVAEFDFTVLDIDGFQLEMVPSDSKVAAGAFGTVLYWSVEDLSIAMQQFEHLGAKLYRGPMAIENGLGICQFKDPFGNLIGLRGQYQ